MTNPIDDPKFWRDRLDAAVVESPANIHKAIYNISDVVWDRIHEVHGEILPKMFDPYRHTKVLDAGCGMGDLVPLLPTNVEYIGIDISPDFIKVAYQRFPKYAFMVQDLRRLLFSDQSFDLVICRGIRSMVIENLGQATWRMMEAEMLRVGERLVLLEYTNPEIYRVHDAAMDCKQFVCNTIEGEGGRLVYRPGQDGTIELYDLFVTEENRRKGIASKLIRQVVDDAFGAVYGFTQINNEKIHALYRKLGFSLIEIPGFYRGVPAIMVVKNCLPGLKSKG